MAEATGGVGAIHNLIGEWLIDPTIARSWRAFEFEPNDLTFGNLVHALQNVVKEGPKIHLPVSLYRLWDADLRPDIVQRALHRNYFPDVYFRYVHSSEGFMYMRPAPASRGEAPFRSSAVRKAADFLARPDARVIVLTGGSSEEMSSFVVPPLFSVLEELKMRWVYAESIANGHFKKLVRIIEEDWADAVFIEWFSGMEKNEDLVRLLNEVFLTDAKNRLIIVNKEGTAVPNFVNALKAARFTDRLLPQRRDVSVPVIGLLPQHMSDVQAAEHLFGEVTPKTRGMARHVATRMPLLLPIADKLRSAIAQRPNFRSFDALVQRVVDETADGAGVLVATGNRLRMEREAPREILWAKDGEEVFFLRSAERLEARPVTPHTTILTNPHISFMNFMNRTVPFTIHPTSRIAM